MEDLVFMARAAVLAALLGACAGHGPKTSEPTRGEIDMVSNSLKLAPDGQGWSISFVLQNTTTRELRGTIVEPIAGFSLEVMTETGERLSLVQPALDVPGQPRALALAPGVTEQLQTPIHLRFDPSVPPSGGNDPMTWSIRSAPVPVLLRATLEISGMPVKVAEGRLVPGDQQH